MSDLTYISTRGNQAPIDFYTAILQGIAKDGGLLVPDFKLPQLDLASLKDLNYVDLATEVLVNFVGDEAKEDIRKACMAAYQSGSFDEGIVPVAKAGDIFVTELFHGPTAAFKDMALTMLPHFMTMSLKQKQEDRQVMILTATSGDTGKAALEGFKDVENTNILVFYPQDGVSAIQKQQMVTQTGKNVEVVGIYGNFDDAQSAVKKAFVSEELKEVADQHHVFLSSANSINIGRLIPQIVYYFHSYFELVRKEEIKLGDQINFCIPSGNFGNCLAGYLAKYMGLPVKKFIVASNPNHILTDFFTTGKYDINREFYTTTAPAMDIIISSNLERLVYFLADQDASVVAKYYDDLSKTGVYSIDEKMFARVQEEFYAGYATEDEILASIKEMYETNNYLLDTHTATGYNVIKKYQAETKDPTKICLLSTASAYKFPESVYEVLSGNKVDSYDAIDKLSEFTHLDIPAPIKGIKDREVLHKTTIDRKDIITFIKGRLEAK